MRGVLVALWLAAVALVAPASARQAEAPPYLTPALWEVTDGRSRVLLFGTVHTLPRGVNWFRPHVLEGLESSERLVLETLVPEGPGAMMPAVMRLARLSQPRPVLERVPESWQPELTRAIDRLRPGPLDWYKSWFVALTLTNLQAVANGLDPRIGVEAVLTERARIRNIPVTALETVEQQLVYFDALTEADQQRLLLSTLGELDQSRAKMDALLSDWLSGDVDGLAAKVNRDFEPSPMLRQMLVEDRNARWAAWIADEMKKRPQRLFVAVGAGHLAGARSVQAELQKRGFEVRRLTAEPPPPPRRRRR